MRNLSVRCAGAPLVEGLTFTSSAKLTALIGDASFLPRVLLGEAELSSGELELAGGPYQLALGAGVRLVPASGWLLEDVPLLEGAALAAELFGLPESRKLAKATLTELGLQGHSRAKPSTLEPAERCAVSLALALATRPALVIVEQPLDGLDELRATWLAERLRRLVMGAAAPRLAWTSERLITRAQFDLASESDVAWLRYGRLLAAGSGAELLAQEALCVVRVRGDGAAFRRALAERGVQAEALGSGLEPVDSSAWRVLARDRPAVVDAAVSSSTPVVELSVVEPLKPSAAHA